MKKLAGIVLLCFVINQVLAEDLKSPIRLAIIGLDHDAVGDFISRARVRQDIQLVGIVESNQALVTSYARLFNFNTNFFYPDLDRLTAGTSVQAAAVFTRTCDHRGVVESCATHKIDVLLEKPLAVNMGDALAMAAAVKSSGIQIMVDYETSWYSSIATAYTIVHNQRAIGDPKKIMVIAGDQGPKDAGCSDAFLAWLTDPALSGGGALTDFGCYGADLITWFMAGERPETVLAQSADLKPDIYPRVEDEATILLTYTNAEGIIQASWNLPFSERSLQIYGNTGYVFAPGTDLLRFRLAGTAESELQLQSQVDPLTLTDDISYLVAMVRREVKPSGPSSLEVNLVATEILDAARRSVELHKPIHLPADH
ncbi:MAG TPA: Gfo/Idh/MocA family oxidoreductase [Candidatus Acidoferrales bacterium]|jgi:predicted dehydrogenase|nr:Gfo/Idh/MocA family oxidoreductase [Candidatus Acidoferrales bacterium]